jgi:hypothetical protein
VSLGPVPEGSGKHPVMRLLPRFLAGFLIFILVNLLVAHFMSDCGIAALVRLDACSDDIVRAGWPLNFYEDGGVASHSFFSTYVLLQDLAVGIIGAAIFAVGTFIFRRKTPS